MSVDARNTSTVPVEVEKLTPFFSDERRDLVFLMRQAEAAERFEDMAAFARRLVRLAQGLLTREERNLFAIAHKHLVVAKRAAVRTLVYHTNNAKLNLGYKHLVELDVREFCKGLIAYVTENILSLANDKAEDKVFFLKLVGDHYRYLAELDITPDGDHGKVAHDYYREAAAVAEAQLPATDPTRLGLMLNFSVLLYEHSREVKQACDMAKGAFDKAINRLDELDEEDYKDATLVMQLMRDNLALWVTLQQGGAQQQPQH